MNTHQINIKISESDLNKINKKAKRYGLSRSVMMKLFALNGEMSVETLETLKRPTI